MISIRLFTDVENEQKALELLEEILVPIKQFILSKKEPIIQPYWKIKDYFVVECLLELNEMFGDVERKSFLDSIADTWIFHGEPECDVTISDQLPGYLKKGVCFMSIFFNYVENNSEVN